MVRGARPSPPPPVPSLAKALREARERQPEGADGRTMRELLRLGEGCFLLRDTSAQLADPAVGSDVKCAAAARRLAKLRPGWAPRLIAAYLAVFSAMQPRTAEFAYPIRLDPNASPILVRDGERWTTVVDRVLDAGAGGVWLAWHPKSKAVSKPSPDGCMSREGSKRHGQSAQRRVRTLLLAAARTSAFHAGEGRRVDTRRIRWPSH